MVKIYILAFGFFNQLQTIPLHSKRNQSEEVHLDKSALLKLRSGILRYDSITFFDILDYHLRCVFRYRLFTNDNSAGMDTCLSGKSFQSHRNSD